MASCHKCTSIVSKDNMEENCPICLESQQEPFTLPCNHSICKEHLPKVVACPLCRCPFDWEEPPKREAGLDLEVPQIAAANNYLTSIDLATILGPNWFSTGTRTLVSQPLPALSEEE